MKLLAVPTVMVTLAACGLSSDNDSSSDKKKDVWEYNFTENGCSTGDVKGSGKQSYCQTLKDDRRNNGCAENTRRVAFERCLAAAEERVNM